MHDPPERYGQWVGALEEVERFALPEQLFNQLAPREDEKEESEMPVIAYLAEDNDESNTDTVASDVAIADLTSQVQIGFNVEAGLEDWSRQLSTTETYRIRWKLDALQNIINRTGIEILEISRMKGEPIAPGIEWILEERSVDMDGNYTGEGQEIGNDKEVEIDEPWKGLESSPRTAIGNIQEEELRAEAEQESAEEKGSREWKILPVQREQHRENSWDWDKIDQYEVQEI